MDLDIDVARLKVLKADHQSQQYRMEDKLLKYFPAEIEKQTAKEEVERIHEKMDELGIRSMGAYLRKMALDGYCIRLDLQDVKALVSLLRICSNNLNQYAKRANETGSIYHADIEDLQKRLEEIWTDMKEVLVHLSSIQ